MGNLVPPHPGLLCSARFKNCLRRAFSWSTEKRKYSIYQLHLKAKVRHFVIFFFFQIEKEVYQKYQKMVRHFSPHAWFFLQEQENATDHYLKWIIMPHCAQLPLQRRVMEEMAPGCATTALPEILWDPKWNQLHQGPPSRTTAGCHWFQCQARQSPQDSSLCWASPQHSYCNAPHHQYHLLLGEMGSCTAASAAHFLFRGATNPCCSGW